MKRRRGRESFSTPTDGLIQVELDGETVTAIEGQSLLAVLVENGKSRQSLNLATGQHRAGYCGMGMCFECEVVVDTELHVRACMRTARNGMQITTAGSGQSEIDGEKDEVV